MIAVCYVLYNIKSRSIMDVAFGKKSVVDQVILIAFVHSLKLLMNCQ